MTDIDSNDLSSDTMERPLSTADLAQSSVATRGEREDIRSQLADDAGLRNEMVDENIPLFPTDQIDGLRDRWREVQSSFVDEPRSAVEKADELVAGAMRTLAEVFAEERSRLEAQWDRGEDISTEDLRIALQRYRAFFGRLLAI